MLLALDIGNTTTTGGLFDGAALAASFSLQTPALMQRPDLLREAVGARAGDVTAAVAGCVVPDAWAHVAAAVRSACGCPLMRVRADVPLPIRSDVPNPEQVGDDRLLNALAAYSRARGPAIVVDFGTALTIDVVGADGAYRGGVIAPGVQLGAEALSKGTAQLPLVDVEASSPSVLGTDTESAVRSGLIHGVAAMVEGLVARLRQELHLEGAPVYLTGGQAARFAELINLSGDVVPELTLEGIRIAYEQASASAGAAPQSAVRNSAGLD